MYKYPYGLILELSPFEQIEVTSTENHLLQNQTVTSFMRFTKSMHSFTAIALS